MGLPSYHDVRSLVGRDAKSPLAWILGATIAVRLVGLGWGLPSSDGWDNDGIAPRDFWPGLIETFTPGHYFTYPPAHLALLALLTAPITAIILLRAPAYTQAAVLAEALKVPYMTAFSLVARGVSVAMSIGIVYAVAEIAREVAGRRAGYAAAAVCAVNVTLTYYAHTSNLDVPYVFWATLALLALTRCLARDEPARLRSAFALAALAVASKDQAYALFLLGVPLALAVGIASGVWRGPRLRAVLREAAFGAAIGGAILLVVDGAIVNPTGFFARVRFLVGPASDPYAYYSADTAGRWLAFVDSVRRFDEHYPLVVAALALAGLARTRALTPPRARAAGLVPACAIVSYTLLFNCIARRTEQRFLLPQMVLWATYAGIGLDWLLQARTPRLRPLVVAGCVAAFAWGVFRCLDVDANLILDPRYDAEAWLASHVAQGDVVEVEGKSVYLLRPPARARFVRVGPDPVEQRNPLYGAEERQDALSNVGARAPQWIVVSEVYAKSYLEDAREQGAVTGRVFSGTQIQANADDDATHFFRGLRQGRLGYQLAHVSTWTSRFWPRLDIHGSVGRETWIFERAPMRERP